METFRFFWSVGHSGAGALLPSIAAANPSTRSIAFVDALLPHPGRSWFSTAPESLSSHLRGMANAGYLPAWSRWWPDGAIESLLGGKNEAENFAAELDELPLAYFEEAAPVAPLPRSIECFYLQLSEACRSDSVEAEKMGWPVKRLSLNHLAMLTDPETVAAAILDLVQH